MFNKTRLLFLAVTLPIISSNASAFVEAIPSNKINLNESVTIDWYQYAQKFPNQTYNLYVTKPNGEPEHKYRSGLTETSDVRGPNTISGTQKIVVEACDQYGQNCFKDSKGRVSVTVDHQCELTYSSFGQVWSYDCDGLRVTQAAASRYATSDFISIKDRLYWLHRSSDTMISGGYAWYTSCRSGGEIERVTQYVSTLSGRDNGRISDFVPSHASDSAKWTYYSTAMGTSSQHTASFSKCN